LAEWPQSKREVSRIIIAMNKDESRMSCDLLRKDADENRRIRATGDAPGLIEPLDRARGRAELHGLSPVQTRNANRFRRRPQKSADDVGR